MDFREIPIFKKVHPYYFSILMGLRFLHFLQTSTVCDLTVKVFNPLLVRVRSFKNDQYFKFLVLTKVSHASHWYAPLIMLVLHHVRCTIQDRTILQGQALFWGVIKIVDLLTFCQCLKIWPKNIFLFFVKFIFFKELLLFLKLHLLILM